jgi:hypothetical protein
VLEAFFFLTLARTAIAFLPFSWISRTMRAPRARRPDAIPRAITDVRSAVLTAVRTLAPSAVCLPQALAGHWILGRRGVPSVVCFGVRRDTAAALEAHAWLRVADRVVLGEKALDSFTYLVEFPSGESATQKASDSCGVSAIVPGARP